MTHKTLTELINLTGKTAIVTGGAMGIGLGIARRLLEAGAAVVIADMNEDAGTQAVTELRAQSDKVSFVKVNVADEADVARVVEHTVNIFGSLDILVNNAGIYPNVPALSMSTADFDRVTGVNLRGVFLMTKAAAAAMITQGGGGKIINITSVDALHPSSVGLAAYDASKHGVWGFTKNIALEFAPYNIQVNAIAPGAIATPGVGAGANITPQMQEIITRFIQKIPMKRMGDPDEIGTVAVFLASPLASYITGTQIVVDGGVLLS